MKKTMEKIQKILLQVLYSYLLQNNKLLTEYLTIYLACSSWI